MFSSTATEDGVEGDQNHEIRRKFKLRFKFQANKYEDCSAEDEKTSKPCLTFN